MRLPTAAAVMLLSSISLAIAQPTPNTSESPSSSTSQSPTPAPSQTPTASVESSASQGCIFADSRFSEGAQFCVTGRQALKCENGRWSPVTMYCGGERTLRSEDYGYHGNENRGYRDNDGPGYRDNEDHGYRDDEDQGYRGEEDSGNCPRQL
jgi:hypothetical protein